MMEPGLRVAAALCLWAIAILAPGSAAARDRGADGRFASRRSSHFVLYQDVDIDRASGWRGSVEFEKQVLAALESAHDQLDQLLGLRPRRDVEVWIYDPAIFDGRFGGRFRFPVAGFYHGAVRVRGDVELTPRLIAGASPRARSRRHRSCVALLSLPRLGERGGRGVVRESRHWQTASRPRRVGCTGRGQPPGRVDFRPGAAPAELRGAPPGVRRPRPICSPTPASICWRVAGASAASRAFSTLCSGFGIRIGPFAASTGWTSARSRRRSGRSCAEALGRASERL